MSVLLQKSFSIQPRKGIGKVEQPASFQTPPYCYNQSEKRFPEWNDAQGSGARMLLRHFTHDLYREATQRSFSCVSSGTECAGLALDVACAFRFLEKRNLSFVGPSASLSGVLLTICDSFSGSLAAMDQLDHTKHRNHFRWAVLILYSFVPDGRGSEQLWRIHPRL